MSDKPVCEDLRHVCGGCGFKWPERSAYDELVTKLAAETERAEKAEKRILNALEAIERFASIDGAHHKQWVIDQIVRSIADDYAKWARDRNADTDYDSWDIGIAP